MSKRIYVKAGTIKLPDMYDAKVHATLQMVASPKALLSRLRTNPNGELVEASCVVASSGSVRYVMLMVADLVSFRLPVGTTSVSLIFEPKGSKRVETFSVIIDLVGKSLEIVGNRNEVVDLCSWLYMPLWGNV